MQVCISRLLLALVCVLPTWAGDDAPGVRSTSLAVVMQFDESYSQESMNSMKRELESILDAAGVHLDWRLLNESTSRESFTNLVVTRFHGKCRSGAPHAERRRASTLGLTHVSSGEILPFSEVDCERLAGLVSEQLLHRSPAQADRLLGKAMGRVLAHELYHILARTPVHSAKGVAKAALTPADLLFGKLRFEAAQANAIRTQMAPAPPPVVTARRTTAGAM